jgi:hypothetical protein
MAMKETSIAILEKHKQHWHTLKHAGYVNNLQYPVKLDIQKVIQDEQDPNYHENLWCPECLVNMIKRAYTMYERHLEFEAAAKKAAEELSAKLQQEKEQQAAAQISNQQSRIISVDTASSESVTVVSEVTNESITIKVEAPTPAPKKKSTKKKTTK